MIELLTLPLIFLLLFLLPFACCFLLFLFEDLISLWFVFLLLLALDGFFLVLLITGILRGVEKEGTSFDFSLFFFILGTLTGITESLSDELLSFDEVTLGFSSLSVDELGFVNFSELGFLELTGLLETIIVD